MEKILKEFKEAYILHDGRCSPKAKQKLLHNEEHKQFLEKNYTWLDVESSAFSEIWFVLQNNIKEQPQCPVCDNVLKFSKPLSKYPSTCSKQCSAIRYNKPRFKNNNPAKQKKSLHKRVVTRKHNFRSGRKEVLNSKNWLYNAHCVNLESISNIATRLGVHYSTVKRALAQHGINSPNKNKLRTQSLFTKYGTSNCSHIPGVREKAKNTIIDRYGSYTNSSQGEKELQNFVNQLATCYFNTSELISPYELDIFIPEHNIAIEYCGLYWHSDIFKPINYHRDKMKRCNQQNIRLLTIFSDEWEQHRDLVKQKIKHILGKSDNYKVHGRKCDVRNLTTKEKQNFFALTHIQGNGPGSVNYGLVYNEEIIAAISFIKRNDGSYVLNRYSTRCIIPGGFSKLFNHFVMHNAFTYVDTFADLRWSTGDLYHKTGWEKVKELRPDYYWCKNGKRFHKFQFRHKFLEQKLDTYDPSLSEAKNCRNNGFYKIYNCGLEKYRFNK